MDNNMNNMGQPVGQQPANSGAGIDVNKIINDLKNDKKSLIGLVGALIVIIANFLTLFSIKLTIFGTSKSESVSFWKYDGAIGEIVFFLAIGTIVLIILKKHIYTVLTAGLSLILTIVEFFSIKSDYKKSVKGLEKYASLNWGIGFWLTLIGLAVIGVSIYLIWKENPNCFKDAIEKVKAMFGGNKAQTVQPVQAPVTPVAPVAPQAPVEPQATVPTENINNDINNNVM